MCLSYRLMHTIHSSVRCTTLTVLLYHPWCTIPCECATQVATAYHRLVAAEADSARVLEVSRSEDQKQRPCGLNTVDMLKVPPQYSTVLYPVSTVLYWICM